MEASLCENVASGASQAKGTENLVLGRTSLLDPLGSMVTGTKIAGRAYRSADQISRRDPRRHRSAKIAGPNKSEGP